MDSSTHVTSKVQSATPAPRQENFWGFLGPGSKVENDRIRYLMPSLASVCTYKSYTFSVHVNTHTYTHTERKRARVRERDRERENEGERGANTMGNCFVNLKVYNIRRTLQ